MKKNLPMLNERYVHAHIDGTPVNFVRRRYSNKTFTWVEAFIGGEWVSLGDPWPCVVPARKQMLEEIQKRREQVLCKVVAS